MRRAVYAGSFDPPTNGHVWMIEQGAALFDEISVAVGENPEKRPLFDLATRLEMLREIAAGFGNVAVGSFSNRYLVRYAAEIGARFILRGIRNEADYAYERAMRNVNDDLEPRIATVFLMPPRALGEVSSSMVRGLIGPDGWQGVVEKLVPPAVHARLLRSVP